MLNLCFFTYMPIKNMKSLALKILSIFNFMINYIFLVIGNNFLLIFKLVITITIHLFPVIITMANRYKN